MFIFKKEKKNEILKGRTTRYTANKLDIHEFYLGNILNGHIGCSRRLARDITRLVGNEAKVDEYFTIKEK